MKRHGVAAIIAVLLVGCATPSTSRLTLQPSEYDYKDVIPIVRVEPIFPRVALRKRISGHVILDFIVLENGSVTDIVVRESRPAGLYDKSAVQALKGWKFKPLIVDGKPVARRATQKLEYRVH